MACGVTCAVAQALEAEMAELHDTDTESESDVEEHAPSALAGEVKENEVPFTE